MHRSAILPEKRLPLYQLRYELLQQFRYIQLRFHGVIKENWAYNPSCGYFVVNLHLALWTIYIQYIFSRINTLCSILQNCIHN